MAISGAASKVAKKFQNSKINQKLTKKLDDVTSSLKSKTKNITANIAKKTKEATQKAVNTVSDKAKTIANKTLSGTNIVKNAISNGIKNAPKSAKNKVASVIDSLGKGILTVQNTFAPEEIAKTEYGEVVVKKIKTGFGQSGEETLSQFLSKDVKQLKTMFFSQNNKSGSRTVGDNNQSIVYRVIRNDENPVNGLFAKNPTRGMTIEGHVISGSRNKGSQFISTTTDINVAKYYSTKHNLRIVEIDLNKLRRKNTIYDLSTQIGRETYLKGSTARAFAKGSKEVLIEGFIPADALKVIKEVSNE